jgi:hypothetical protein
VVGVTEELRHRIGRAGDVAAAGAGGLGEAGGVNAAAALARAFLAAEAGGYDAARAEARAARGAMAGAEGGARQGLGGVEALSLAWHVEARSAFASLDAGAARAALDELAGLGERGLTEAAAAALLATDALLGSVPSIAAALPAWPEGPANNGEPGRRAETLRLLTETVAGDTRLPDSVRSRVVVALLGAGDAAGALEAADTLMATGAANAGWSRWFELLRADALLASGDEPGAFAVYRERVAATPPERYDDRRYWHAWARILSILQANNADGSRTEAMAREIRRLRRQPSWGEHADCCALIDGIAERIGVTPGER